MKTYFGTSASLVIILLLLSGTSSGQESTNTTLVGRWANGPCNTADVYRNIACIGNGAYLEVIDASYPDHPARLGKIFMPGIVEILAGRVFCQTLSFRLDGAGSKIIGQSASARR